MCDDLTRQEILFFTVIQAEPSGISEDQIFEDMSKLALEMKWPSYLNTVPKPLSERLVEARERGMIVKERPLRWKAGPNVGGYVEHLAKTYLGSSGEKIIRHIKPEMHAAE